ncbi:hypothetical protein HPP92_018861 [Vanilla planifolia]|uniref:Uncharacterized protein n=1 Tax=Vanilla planifolia TaxID=51239 RepID=A0A835QAN7_VANPL|nr:hypothetical protein HPP92_018861 [Vanilla planifolia]
MGTCFSSSSSVVASRPSNAIVVDIEGSLKEFPESSTTADILTGNHPSFILCDADTLFYGQFVQPLSPSHTVDPGHLYFVLAASILEYRLTAADMSALAVRASSAFSATVCGKRKAFHVLPVPAPIMEVESYMTFNEASVERWKCCAKEKTWDEGEEMTPTSSKLCSIEEVAE